MSDDMASSPLHEDFSPEESNAQPTGTKSPRDQVREAVEDLVNTCCTSLRNLLSLHIEAARIGDKNSTTTTCNVILAMIDILWKIRDTSVVSALPASDRISMEIFRAYDILRSSAVPNGKGKLQAE